jgi:CRISPR-associated protein Csm4
MQLQIWRLEGRLFHFGKQGFGQEETLIHWPSDSLYAALTARLAALKGAEAVEKWMQPFLNGSPPFLLTSLFPYAGEIYFFPSPLAPQSTGKGQLPAELRPKDLKKVRYVSEGLYRRLITGRSLADEAGRVIQLQQRKVWLLPEEQKLLPKGLLENKIWEEEKRPRVTVGRIQENSNLFHVGEVHFVQECGLWFGVQWHTSDNDIQNLFALLLNDLGDAGLGAERSSGYGRARFKIANHLELPDPDGKMWTSLSRYLPREEEVSALLHPQAAYQIQMVSGWLDSPQKPGQRRRLVRMLAEGAVLGALSSFPYGDVVDVRPKYPTNEDPLGHPVYRCGLAVAVGYGGEA